MGLVGAGRRFTKSLASFISGVTRSGPRTCPHPASLLGGGQDAVLHAEHHQGPVAAGGLLGQQPAAQQRGRLARAPCRLRPPHLTVTLRQPPAARVRAVPDALLGPARDMGRSWAGRTHAGLGARPSAPGKGPACVPRTRAPRLSTHGGLVLGSQWARRLTGARPRWPSRDLPVAGVPLTLSHRGWAALGTWWDCCSQDGQGRTRASGCPISCPQWGVHTLGPHLKGGRQHTASFSEPGPDPV